MSLGFVTGYLLGQQGRQSARLASTAAASGGPSIEDVLDITDRIDRLALVVEAMWSMLEDAGYSAEDLRQRIAALDEADGTPDGRRTPQTVQCRTCGARVAPGLPACQFCGTEIPGATDDPFTSV
ncbi:MAG: hypothetical protein QNJ71_06940 [Acidimicrobiia bacterium]|nr:hypothetical protein [Acidimicrobiia bacterium]